MLLLAWETPVGQQALRGNGAMSMSIEFSRELLKAYRTGDSRVHLDLCKEVRDKIFWGRNHPCCVIDSKGIGRNDLIEMIDKLAPQYVLLLGSKVTNKISREDLRKRGRVVLPLGFPRGENQRRNIALLKMQDAFRQLMLPLLIEAATILRDTPMSIGKKTNPRNREY